LTRKDVNGKTVSQTIPASEVERVREEMFKMGKTIAEHVAEVAINTNFEDLSEEAVRHAKKVALDLLASMVGTRNVITSRIARETAGELGGPEEATIVGSPKKVSVPGAAFANAIQCYGLDFVDDHNESNSHPSAATYPVSLAISEHLKKSGKEFIAAAALGNEVVCRMGTCYLGEMYYQGFHPTSVLGTIGGTVSASKLMGLNAGQTVDAQGIAGSMAGGLMAWNSTGSFTKRVQAGHPAMNSIIAARMAAKGFNGPSDIFESADGLFHAYSYKDHYDGKYLAGEGFGEEWLFASSSIKVYPCCRYSSGHIDACLEIVNKFHPKAEDIEKIDIRSSKYTIHLLAEPRKWDPKNIVDLQFSMPFQAAIAFVSGKVTVDEIDVKHISNPLVQKLIKATNVVMDDVFESRYPDQFSSAVTITMKDGSQHSAVIDNPKGDWRNPVTYEEVVEKFRYLANRVYSERARTEKIIDFIANLEERPDMSALMVLLNDAAK
jgi:2-methylcitrate dehydratase PrpD